MIKINCPKCKSNVEINISKAVDECAEIFICNNCGYKFRYAPNGRKELPIKPTREELGL